MPARSCPSPPSSSPPGAVSRAGEGCRSSTAARGTASASPARSMRFLAHPAIDVGPASVIHAGRPRRFTTRSPAGRSAAPGKLLPPVVGRRNAAGSRSGTGSRPWRRSPPEIVLVHDAARPFASADLIDRRHRGRPTAPGRRARHPGHRHDQGRGRGRPRRRHAGRARLRAVQTPQAFAYDALLDAHRRAAAAGSTASPTTARWPSGRAFPSTSSRAIRRT